ncbi:MAG: patatin-like phospholipase family protein [Peptoniphilus sp.]|uniref:patatin-like phospholipase family protein n=1 Tax=Peptoniphilus sp. TaxID=1971214 RepID=UPI0025E2536D|nr:patatin-like phospholipase family protein [Peptoniphilus sp.]MCI5643777.1 patatin-like phospholipase family protein [Peptoniphilus sp.]
MKKWGLVLEGGGAKGAYQVGAYFALMEMGFNFSKIVGTSIGAFNGAMFAQGDAYECFKAWKNLDFSSFVNELKSVEEDQDILTKIVEKLRNHDIKIPELTRSPYPLFRLVDQFIDEEKLRSSDIDFGICTVNVSDLKVEKLFKEDIEKGLIKDYIIASCYIPFFKLKPLHGKIFLDGGFASPAPIEMIDDDIDIVLVRLSDGIIKNEERAKYIIKPNKRLGSALGFDTNRADELIKNGYFDAFRTVKGLKGEDYYILPIKEEESLKYIYKILKDKVDEIDNKVIRKIFEEYAPKVAAELDMPENFKYDELLYKLLESEAEKKKIDRYKIYTVEGLVREIENGF